MPWSEPWFLAVVVFVVGVILSIVLARALRRVVSPNTTPERAVLLYRVALYGGTVLTFMGAARELGFDLSVLLGAAGVFTVAIGFASQTSASNVISGLFVVAERPFSVGDFVQVGDAIGEVLSIDFLSVKLRTAENLYVRVPNETVMKATTTNYTRFAIRRIDLLMSVAPETDVEALQPLLIEVADNLPAVLDEPRPAIQFDGFDGAGTRIKFTAWTRRQVFLDSKRQLALALHKRLRNEGVALGMQHVRVQDDKAATAAAASRTTPNT